MAGAVSRASLAEVTERFEELVGTADAASLGAELFAVLHLLDREHGLRRTLADPATFGQAKAQIVRSLLEGKLGEVSVELAAEVVSRKWSTSAEMTDGFERLAVGAYAVAAERSGDLDRLEDDLFRFTRVVAGEPELRDALSGTRIPAEKKAELLAALLEGKAAPASQALITEAVTHPRGRSLESELEEYGKVVAERRGRLVALVRTAIPLNGEQQTRLAAALGASYGRDVHLNIELDPTVLGGIAIQIGDEAIDGTIAGRLDGVRRRIA